MALPWCTIGVRHNCQTPRLEVVARQLLRSVPAAKQSGVALRQYTAPTSSMLYYLHGDHLGSVSVTTCGNSSGRGGVPSGGVLAQQKYDAWGNVRSGSGAMPTDVGFTAQRSDATGLMYYRARYYAPYLNRWIQPDTIVPQPGNPQDLNRYSYTRNNPLKYVDPSGHYSCYAGQGGSAGVPQSQQCIAWVETALGTLGTAGQLGIDLVDFFRAHNEITVLFSAAVDYMMAPPLGLAIHINLGLLGTNLATRQGKGLVSAFGHEIDHLRNAGDRVSIRGEIKAYEVERQLRSALGADPHPVADQLHGLNPYNRADLFTARNILGDLYDEYLISPIGDEAVNAVYEASRTSTDLLKIGIYGLNRASQAAQALLTDLARGISNNQRFMQRPFQFR